jgi:nicotinamide-nucleotide amidase
MMTSDDISVRVRTLATLLGRRGQRLATAESCTGGLVAGAITALPGSSTWYERGWVTYSNAAKIEELDVDAHLLATHGAVSEVIAAAMASGARMAARADFALSITGIAGPDGGTPEKPVGMVCFGWATPTHTRTETWHFSGNRQRIREEAVAHALAGLIALLMNDAA